MKAALIILDPQNDFFSADNPNVSAFEATIPLINEAINLFRAERLPVVFVQHTTPGKPAGTQPWAIDSRFDFRPVDIQVSKSSENAFWNTGLDGLLRSMRIDLAVIAGYVAERCVLSTVRGAQERGYRVSILDGAIAGLSDYYTQITLELSPHMTLDELQGEIAAATGQSRVNGK